MIESPSPNHDARPDGGPIDILLLHYTGMPTARDALDRLRDPEAKVSAHYLIEEDGRVHRLVPEARRAWHAGVACWAGATDINARSIGIELVNPGHQFGYRPFPEPQMAALIPLCHGILARHPIPPERVLGHSDVAPTRKEDPGELFDWRRLARSGIGIWPQEADTTTLDLKTVQESLAAFGYCVPTSGDLDEPTRAVLRAFQRRFRPSAVTGKGDDETARLARGAVQCLPAERAADPGACPPGR